MNAAEKAVIADVLCSQALADHLGDVRDAEADLWKLIEVPELPEDHPDRWSNSAWRETKARLRLAGLLPEMFAQDDDDDE